MPDDFPQLTLIANFEGKIQYATGNPKRFGLVKKPVEGREWWTLFPSKADQTAFRNRFFSEQGAGQALALGAIEANHGPLAVRLIRLAESETARSDWAITITPQSTEARTPFEPSASLSAAPYPEERFRLSVRIGDVVTWIYDIPSGSLTLQGSASCILGYGVSDISPRDSFWWGLVHPEDEAALKREIESCCHPGVDEWTLEHRFRNAAGEFQWVKQIGKVVFRDEEGSCLQMIGAISLSDEVELRNAYRELERREQLLSEMSQIAKIGGWSYDVATDDLEWSKEVYRIIEVGPDHQPTIASALARFPPDAVEKIDTALKKAIEDGVPYHLDLPFITEKGNWRWIRTTGFAEVENGQTKRIFGVFQDLTEVDKVKRDLQTFFKTSAELLAIVTFDGRFMELSDSWQKMLGYSTDELKEADFASFVHPEDRAVTDKVFAQALRGMPIRNFENRYRHKDGHYKTLSWISVTDLERKQIRAAARDVTDLRSLNQKLTDALHAANAANEAKNQFLAVMSHELKTPLNPIVGFTEILASEIEDEAQSSMLQSIQESAKRLASLIEDILQVNSIDSSLYKIESKLVLLADFRTDVISNFQQSASAKNLELKIEIASDSNPCIVIDDRLLKNVIFNLIGNSIKFTDSGYVKLRLETETVSDSIGHLRFSVSDTGIGINASCTGKIFEPFTQADSSSTREFGGAGLGLTICRKSIELLDGTIKVESRASEGSRFYGTIPFRRLQSIQSGKVISRPFSLDTKTRILIVDDDRADRLLLRNLIEELGANADEAFDGESALEAIANRPYDLIFMDVHFPGISGLDTTRKIRSITDIEQPYIIASTADVAISKREMCVGAGMDNYLSKPISMEKMQRVLDEYNTFKTPHLAE